MDPSVKRQIEADMEEASQLVFHSKIEVAFNSTYNSAFNSANVYEGQMTFRRRKNAQLLTFNVLV